MVSKYVYETMDTWIFSSLPFQLLWWSVFWLMVVWLGEGNSIYHLSHQRELIAAESSPSIFLSPLASSFLFLFRFNFDD